MTALKECLSNQNRFFIVLAFLSPLLLLIWGFKNFNINGKGYLIEKVDSIVKNTRVRDMPSAELPQFYKLYAHASKMKEIFDVRGRGRSGSSRAGQKVVFQFYYSNSGLTLAAFTGKNRHNFDDDSSFVPLDVLDTISIPDIKEELILGDMELSDKGPKNDFSDLKDFVNRNSNSTIFFTPVMGKPGAAIANHVIYKVTASLDCGNGKSVLKDCYIKAIDLKMSFNPVPPRTAQ